MKDLLIKLRANIKNHLGLCCSKGCYKKATVEVGVPILNIKRGLCEKHLIEFKELLEE